MLRIREKSLPIPAHYIEQLKATEQNPRYHAEGNVYNHTLLVLQQFEKYKLQFDLSSEDQEVLYWATILHDIGKPSVTRWVNNRWSARGHEKAGVPIARDILLQRPEISTSQRQRILSLVRWHNLPLWWMLENKPIEAYKRLSTRTDLRLLGIFTYFDIQGRICDQKEHILNMIQRLNEVHIPQIGFEMDTYANLQFFYQKANHLHKNALWNALRQDDLGLLQKLLQVDRPASKRPKFQCAMSIGTGDVAQTSYLKSYYPGHVYYRLDDFFANGEDTQVRKNKMREVKRFLSVYMRGRKPVLLDGTNLDEELRGEIASFIRHSGGELTYLFFDRALNGLLDAATDETEKERIQLAYQELEMPHPWEAHKLEVVTGL
jgi:putative nucleotidyltransferase with HDIG domain